MSSAGKMSAISFQTSIKTTVSITATSSGHKIIPTSDTTISPPPTTKEPQTEEPQTKEPQTEVPQTGEPQTEEPQTEEPETGSFIKTKFVYQLTASGNFSRKCSVCRFR